ncbi:MAG: hypothetical protein RIB78_00110 [Gammaproteobacteria bacterium]
MITRQVKRQLGLSAITALVLIVLLALIGAYLATFLSVSAVNTASSSREIQAWFAARSGLEWTIHTALNQSCTCGTDCCSASTFPIGSGSAVSLTQQGVSGYEFYLNSCTDSPVSEAGSSYCVYAIDLTARTGTEGEINYALRNLSVSFTDRNAP